MLLAIEDVSRRFGGVQAVKGVSLGVEEGRIFGLIGPNGAGKTTLFNLVTGFLKPDTGRITFSGEDITGLSPHLICERGVARTFQIAKPFEDLTVLKTVAIAALARCGSVREAEDRAEALLRTLRLDGKKEKRGKSLTVVERKRLELARALATGPRLLLLDEVIAGLNPAEVDEIGEIIREMAAGGVTVLMIEHIMRAILALTDHVVVLDCGAKIAEGDPRALLEDPVVIEAYIGREAS